MKQHVPALDLILVWFQIDTCVNFTTLMGEIKVVPGMPKLKSDQVL